LFNFNHRPSLSTVAALSVRNDISFIGSFVNTVFNSRRGLSQAARQGFKTVLMESGVVVLKLETSTLRQSNNFISIDFIFGVGDYVREVTSPVKVSSDPMSGRDATWGQKIRVL